MLLHTRCRNKKIHRHAQQEQRTTREHRCVSKYKRLLWVIAVVAHCHTGLHQIVSETRNRFERT